MAKRGKALLGALIAVTASAESAALPERHAVAITGVNVVDVERGRAEGPRTVLVDEGRIVSITTPSATRIPDRARRVDGRGRFLIPGLVDMHVHLFNIVSHRAPNDWTLALYVANGVTAVREMNADAASIAIVRRWRKAFDEGSLAAPRILAAGISVHAKTPEEAARQVGIAADAGADFIKVFSEITQAPWRATLDAARARSLPVAGHVPAGVSLIDAAAAGQRSDEHLMQAFEACSPIEAELLESRRGLQGEALEGKRDEQEARVLDAFDRVACERVAKSLAATHQVQVPTLILPYEESIRSGRAPADDPRWRYLRSDERARWERILASVPSHADALAKRRWQVAREIVSIFRGAGVPMLAGTDGPGPAVYPGFALHEELALLVDAGLEPREALRAATRAPAEFLGIADSQGSIAAGMRADLVLLDANPLDDIRNTRRIRAVIVDGRLLTRGDLDAMLEDAARPQTQ